MTALASRYQDRLCSMPSPGQGRHTELLGIANLGIMAGVNPEQIHSDIRNAVSSERSMPDREIKAAVSKAAADHGDGNATYRPPAKPAPFIRNGKTALRRIIDQGTIRTEADLREASPVKLPDDPAKGASLFLHNLFDSEDLVFIGDRLEQGIPGKNIRRAGAWMELFESGGSAGPHIIVNPLSGQPAPKKDGSGEQTYRGDGNVVGFIHCLVEFDNISLEDQIRFWSAAKLPILALIDSGGKSIHAWLDVCELSNCSSADQWQQDIKLGLYEKVLVPFGVDRACSNPSRLSRLPGHLRAEKGKWQRLLWLSPVVREVAR